MSTHRFTVNVPNPTDRNAVAQLELRRTRLADLGDPPLDAPPVEVKFIHFGLSLDPCEEGRQRLSLRLAPRSSVDVYVNAVTADAPDPNVGGVAAMQLIDRRAGKVAGGVLLACIERAFPDTPRIVVPARKACPVVLADLYGSRHAEDPTKLRTHTLALENEFTLVGVITNPTSRPLAGVTIYLEHLGLSGATFIPQTWNVGTLRPQDIFYATWAIMTAGAQPGAFESAIVVQSKGSVAKRLNGQLKIRRPSGRKPARDAHGRDWSVNEQNDEWLVGRRYLSQHDTRSTGRRRRARSTR